MLTKQQMRVLRFIERSLERTGLSPSLQEICGGLGVSSLSTVFKHLAGLEREGYIARTGNATRRIAVLHPSQRNGAPWKHCAHDHAPILHQGEKCPCCVMYQQFVDAAAVE